jgi:hypothetical protein
MALHFDPRPPLGRRQLRGAAGLGVRQLQGQPRPLGCGLIEKMGEKIMKNRQKWIKIGKKWHFYKKDSTVR